MLDGIPPLLSGELLMHLDAMGHSDAVVVADAHFPAHRLGVRVVDLLGGTATRTTSAVRTVLPLDEAPAVDLMRTSDGSRPSVHDELLRAAGTERARWLSREEFYAEAERAFCVVRTGETRTYANAVLRKGVVAATKTPGEVE